MFNLKISIIYPLIIFSILFLPKNNHAQDILELTTPIWSFAELPNDDLLFPGQEINIKFNSGGKCIVDISRIEKDIALVDISECDTVEEIKNRIPTVGELTREYSPIWFRPISENEKKLFPLNNDSHLIIGRLPADTKIKVIFRSNYKSLYNKKFQYWYKISSKYITGWVPEEELSFETDKVFIKNANSLKDLKIEIIKPKRVSKFSPGYYLFGKYKAKLGSMNEDLPGTDIKKDYTNNSIFTVAAEGGTIGRKTRRLYNGYAQVEFNSSNETVQMPTTFLAGGDVGYVMRNGFVPTVGLEYETFNSYSVDDNGPEVARSNTMAWAHVGVERKIFSLQDIGRSLGLQRLPYGKKLFRLLDHSFYLKLKASISFYGTSDNTEKFRGTKIQVEFSSRIFQDIEAAAYYQRYSLSGISEISGQKIGVSVGYAFF